MRDKWTGRPTYYFVTLLTAGATALAVWWWAYFFGPDLDDRGAGLLMIYFPGVFAALLAGLVSFLLYWRVRERESKVLLTINLVFLFGYALFFLRMCMFMLLPVDSAFADSTLEAVFMFVLLAGTPVFGCIVYKRLETDGNKSIHKSGFARM